MYGVPINISRKLLSYGYDVSNSENAFNFVYYIFQKLGYCDDNGYMLHDYIFYVICDLLTKNNIPFVTKDDIKNNKIITTYFDNNTPDLMIKDRKIFDICITNEDTEHIKEKYEKFGSIFDYNIITPNNMISILQTLFNNLDIYYLFENYQIFVSEYAYWMSCFNIGKIIKNESQNYYKKHYPCNPTFEAKRDKFKNAILTKLINISNDDT